MRCDRYREAASAALDGESPGVPAAALDEHRRTCCGCAAWQRDVEALTRRVRVREAETAPADLLARIVTDVVLPGRRLRRRVAVVRWALAVVALVQVAVAAPALFGDDLGMAMSLHASHESAAWNAAIGVALLLVALRPARVGGALAVLAPFVLVLTVLSVLDLASGRVGIDRLSTHLGVVVGVVLLAGLTRARRGLPGTPDAGTAEGGAAGEHVAPVLDAGDGPRRGVA